MGIHSKICFIGGGVMAGAILRSLLDTGKARAEDVVVSDPAVPARERAGSLGVRATENNSDAAVDAEVIILAVKPQEVGRVLSELRDVVKAAHLLISIAPGITTTQIEEALGKKVPVARVMPNTPLLVGAGASGYCLGEHALEEHAVVVEEVFGAGGRCVRVAEKLLDAVTGLSGSGPAYVCLLIEALADGGVRMGLPRDVAVTLAAQTVMGAAKLILETGEHPAVLKDRVATPGGTTIAGLAALEEAGARSAMIRAVEAATLRSAELGRK